MSPCYPPGVYYMDLSNPSKIRRAAEALESRPRTELNHELYCQYTIAGHPGTCRQWAEEDRVQRAAAMEAGVIREPEEPETLQEYAARTAHVPTEAAARKALPLFSGVLKYFPDALLEVAAVSKAGNDQHNPGQPLHWDKSKSKDEADALSRHLLDHGTRDSDGQRHSAKVAWRALALLQREIDAERGQS